MTLILGIPREGVAFAAGVHGCTDQPWVAIAGALSVMGFGIHHPSDVETAVGMWCSERNDFIDNDRRDYAAAVLAPSRLPPRPID